MFNYYVLLLLLIYYDFKIYFDKLTIDLYKYEELNNHLQKKLQNEKNSKFSRSKSFK
jgi:hypothetical protein